MEQSNQLEDKTSAQGVRMGCSDALDSALGISAASKIARDDLGYEVHIPCFDGPLDLLLHLIHKEQINIRNIPVSKVCKSYLDYLVWMQGFDVNVASEYMLMAATLTHLKSVMILPQEAMPAEEDPRLPLIQQLLEYERFKKAAEAIDGKSWMFRDVFARHPETFNDVLPEESLLTGPVESVDPFQLLLCLKVAMNRTHKPPMQITTDSVSISEKVSELTLLLDHENVVDISRLLPANPKKQDIIISFLAVLELARLKFLEIIQTVTYGPIQVRGTRSLRDINVSMMDQY